jgi:hypothetical protein
MSDNWTILLTDYLRNLSLLTIHENVSSVVLTAYDPEGRKEHLTQELHVNVLVRVHHGVCGHAKSENEQSKYKQKIQQLYKLYFK